MYNMLHGRVHGSGGEDHKSHDVYAWSGFKYREVVRKKAEREQLQGFDCQDCRNFYQALTSWGGTEPPMPACGHARQGGISMDV